MKHYKSWSGLKRQLTDLLCDELKGRLSYFLTSYSEVHNSYGRAAIRLEGRELVCFSWVEMRRQERDVSEALNAGGVMDSDAPELKKKWDERATYHNRDFLAAATEFLQMPIAEALHSGNYLIRIFAIVDRRIGRRTLLRINEQGDFRSLPDWVKQFYELHLRGLDL